MTVTWRPGASPDVIKMRADMNRTIRDFFATRRVLEVETPVLAATGVSDPHLMNFTTQYHQPGEQQGRSLYLQTSPEYAMKRLLAADLGSIYQISKAFRNEEQGRLHNPEFTLLEWYRVGFDHWQMMAEIEALIQQIIATAPFTKLSYQQAFIHYLSLDPLSASLEQLQHCCHQHGFSDLARHEHNPDTLLQLLFSHKIETHIGQQAPCFIYDFPASQSALAKISQDDSRVAWRFELYFGGIELANGFNELQSASEQANRFNIDNEQRNTLDIEPAVIDNKLLAALSHGLPQCAGVALGLDRLLMLKAGTSSIDEVLTFAIDRA